MNPAGRRLLAFISIALVVDTAAYSTITPLLPGLVAEHSLSKAAAGVLTGSYAIGTLLLALPAAALAARIGPKATVLWALAVLAGASLAFGLASSPALLVGARMLQGVGAAAVWAGALAWVVAIAPRERRAETIGTAIGAAIAGALGGPVLGAAADQIGRGVVFGAFVVVPLGLIVALARTPGPAPIPTPNLAALRAAVREPLMRRGVLLMALPAAGFGVVNVLVPLQLADFGAGAIVIGAVFLGAVLGEAAMSPIAGRAADRRGALRPARIGLVAGGAATALLAIADAPLALALGVMLACPLLGILWAPAMLMLSDGAEVRGIDSAFAFGLANLAYGAGSGLGGTGGGALAQATTDAVPFLAVAGAAVLTAVALR